MFAFNLRDIYFRQPNTLVGLGKLVLFCDGSWELINNKIKGTKQVWKTQAHVTPLILLHHKLLFFAFSVIQFTFHVFQHHYVRDCPSPAFFTCTFGSYFKDSLDTLRLHWLLNIHTARKSPYFCRCHDSLEYQEMYSLFEW